MKVSGLSKVIKQNASEMREVMNEINSVLKEISLNPSVATKVKNNIKQEKFCKFGKCKGIVIRPGKNYCLAHDNSYSSSPPIPMKMPRRCPCGRVIPNKNRLCKGHKRIGVLCLPCA